MKNNSNEETLYEGIAGKGEKTIIDNTDGKSSDNNVDKANDVRNNVDSGSGSRFGRVATGLGFGILMGGAASYVSGKAMGQNFGSDISGIENDGEDTSDTNNSNETGAGETSVETTPETWSDGTLPVSETVTDNMSFSEAFSTARAEVGPGGVFEWRGNVYNTYYAEEWNSLSEGEKSDFVNHLRLEEIENDQEPSENDQNQDSDETVDVVTIDDDTNNDDEIDVLPVNDVQVEPEVEMLGVYHDEDMGMNIGGIMIYGEEVLFLDSDDDNVNFEYMAADINGDGVISEDEIMDISDYDVTVDSLRVDEMSYNDMPDYISDADVVDMV